MKKIKLKPKKSPKPSTKPPPPSSSSNQKSPPKSSKPLSSVHSQKSPPKPTLSLPSSSDQYDRGAILDKCADSQPPPLLQSERLPKVRKVARGKSEDGSTQSLQVCILLCDYFYMKDTSVLYAPVPLPGPPGSSCDA